jgi:hypothetical protein
MLYTCMLSENLSDGSLIWGISYGGQVAHAQELVSWLGPVHHTIILDVTKVKNSLIH